VSIPLAALEEIIDASGVAPRIEARLPTGVRDRQLRVRTLLAGMMLTQADHRPAHLTRVRGALTRISTQDVRGNLAAWSPGCQPGVLSGYLLECRGCLLPLVRGVAGTWHGKPGLSFVLHA
jgi:hypothetical protein